MNVWMIEADEFLYKRNVQIGSQGPRLLCPPVRFGLWQRLLSLK
jgi:hypothetical protein